jgi:hypothetical protein
METWMSFVLFYVKTGEKINECESESDARKQMRDANDNAGFTRIKQHWTNGYELEWCRTTNTKTYDYGPYGFTEYNRWVNLTPEKLPYNALEKY